MPCAVACDTLIDARSDALVGPWHGATGRPWNDAGRAQMADHSVGNIDKRPFRRANNLVPKKKKKCWTKYPVILHIFGSRSLNSEDKEERGISRLPGQKGADCMIPYSFIYMGGCLHIQKMLYPYENLVVRNDGHVSMWNMESRAYILSTRCT